MRKIRKGDKLKISSGEKFVATSNEKNGVVDVRRTSGEFKYEYSGQRVGQFTFDKPLTKTQKKAARIQAKEDSKKAAEKKEAERAETIAKLERRAVEYSRIADQRYEERIKNDRENATKLDAMNTKFLAERQKVGDLSAVVCEQKRALELAGQTISALSKAARS